jgi:peptidoglycan/LPS O-acetylase OafA/YrhL
LFYLAENQNRRAPMPTRTDLQPNNFDLLRLLAAAQVLVIHLSAFFFSHETYVVSVIRQAPGVPVFFFISGFLISATWESNRSIGAFARNRALRLVPAYLAVTVFSLVGILAFAHLNLARDGGKLFLWLGAQLVLLSDWNPDLLRHYGDGVVNGSLWTIPVEVSFYVATPMLYWLMRKLRPAPVLAAAIITSFAIAYLDHKLGKPFGHTVIQLIGLSPLPWFGMFVCGIVARRNLPLLRPYIEGRALIWGIACLALMVASVKLRIPPLLMSGSRYIGILNFVALAGFTLSAAYTLPTLATRLLKRNDISYGLYLVHLPVANMLLANGLTGLAGALATTAIGILLAIASWFVIEQPALRCRVKPLYAH